MAAESLLMEALARIEHKLDLILENIRVSNEFEKVGAIAHTCPVCKQAVLYQVDIQNSVVVRKCGCATGKIALDLNTFAPPTPTKKTEKDDGTGTNEEDRYDSFGRRRNQ